MYIALLLLFIPLFIISFITLLITLYNFAFSGDMVTILFLITIFTTTILSIIVAKLFNKIIPLKTYKDYNRRIKINILSNYFSFIILFFFGVSLIINSFLNKINISEIIIGVGVILLFIYVSYMYILKRDKKEMILHSIEKLDKDIYELTFEDNRLLTYYVNSNNVYKENNSYLVKYNKLTNIIYNVNIILKGDENK